MNHGKHTVCMLPFRKKFIVLVLCVAVLICSIACLPAIDAEAAKKFGTHTFECRDQYQSLVFSNTLSANFEYVSGSKVRCMEAIYMGPAGRTYNVSKQVWTKSWNTKKAEFNTNSFVYITDSIYYYADQSLLCDTKARISYNEIYHRYIGGSK